MSNSIVRYTVYCNEEDKDLIDRAKARAGDKFNMSEIARNALKDEARKILRIRGKK